MFDILQYILISLKNIIDFSSDDPQVVVPWYVLELLYQNRLDAATPLYSWPPKPSKYFSVGIFEYILASMLNVFLDV